MSAAEIQLSSHRHRGHSLRCRPQARHLAAQGRAQPPAARSSTHAGEAEVRRQLRGRRARATTRRPHRRRPPPAPRKRPGPARSVLSCGGPATQAEKVPRRADRSHCHASVRRLLVNTSRERAFSTRRRQARKRRRAAILSGHAFRQLRSGTSWYRSRRARRRRSPRARRSSRSRSPDAALRGPRLLRREQV